MSGRFATLLLAPALFACAGADRHSEPLSRSGRAPSGLTSAPPAEPEAFDVPSASSNSMNGSVRLSSYKSYKDYGALAEARSGMLSNPLLGEGGGVGSGGGGSGLGGTPGRGGTPGVSGGRFSRGGGLSASGG